MFTHLRFKISMLPKITSIQLYQRTYKEDGFQKAQAKFQRGSPWTVYVGSEKVLSLRQVHFFISKGLKGWLW